MPGRTSSQWSNSQKPYVVRYKNGSPVDMFGRPIINKTGHGQNKSGDLHVPLNLFDF
ncbi:hypothetical protein [Saccharicrinis aurantiacus]|uniref:hypothetical protein n=1 Tax=Saccharicrinis aurantiacus TaxID=1849719 RepID=UPI002490B5AC|nr:hypothetical protein [Saccharicrinis aurantiacus]